MARAAKGVKGVKWERKADERPGALLQAALEVFARHGYNATRLELVAEAAGVSKGTIYRYFENKEDLLQKALEERVAVLFAQAEEALEGFKGTPSEKLRFLMDRSWARAIHEDWGRFHRLMFGEIAIELPKLFEEYVRTATLRAWKLFEGVIRAGQESGDFRKDADARGIARFAHSGLCHQAYLQMHMGVHKVDGYPHAKILPAAADLIIAGLEVRKRAAAASAPERNA